VDLNLTWKIATTDIDELKTTLLKVKKSIKR
jgi:uncharacterized protein with HEPN domain